MKNFYLLLIISALFSGCATILTGTKDTISFDSSPSGAVVYKDGLELCRTPCSIPVKRSINKTNIEFRLDGYETRLFALDTKLNVVSVINLGSVFGWAIDAASGSIVKYDRKHYDLDMKLNTLSVSENPREIRIDTRNKVVDVYVSLD